MPRDIRDNVLKCINPNDEVKIVQNSGRCEEKTAKGLISTGKGLRSRNVQPRWRNKELGGNVQERRLEQGKDKYDSNFTTCSLFKNIQQ